MFLSGNLFLGFNLYSSTSSINSVPVAENQLLIGFHCVFFFITFLLYFKVLLCDPGFVKNKINVMATIRKNVPP
jgi:hypothetical protein